MKKLFGILLTTVLLVGMTTGCATTGGTGDGPQIDQQTLNDASIILRNAARSAGALAIQDNPDAVKHVKLAVAVLDTFLVGDNYAPGELVKALEPVIKEVEDVKIALAVNTVTDLYEVFFGRYVKGQVSGAANGNAALFLVALRDGAQQALDITTPAPPVQ